MPARVVEVRELTAIVDFGGIKKEVSSILEPNLRPGDYVIVHAGAIISRISKEEAVEMIKVWKSIYRGIWGERIEKN